MSVDRETEKILRKQGGSIVVPMSDRRLLEFTASVLREIARDPYNRALADELERRARRMSETPPVDEPR